MRLRFPRSTILAASLIVVGLRVSGQTATGYVEVTATKTEEDVLLVPSSVTIISGVEIERSGARNLQEALALTGGVSIAAGGDSGPAGNVPEIWGLRELDAFLLIVDGVPWGGAFVPSTEAIDMSEIERIEVVRGSAPVVYGATAFSGVIHVIHRADRAERRFRINAGSFGSAGAAVTAGSITADFARERFKDDRTGFDRGHVAWRGDKQTSAGRWRFNADVLRLLQDPASPHPREGRALSSRYAIDTNINPEDAHLDETRLNLSARYDALIGQTPWSTTLSLTRSDHDIVRGFLADLDARSGTGFDQTRDVTEAYADSHAAVRLSPAVMILGGVDFLGGVAHATSHVFEYDIDQLGARDDGDEAGARLRDRRSIAALYAQAEWTPAARWRVDIGGRVNHANETRNDEEKTTTRGSGFLGVSRTLGTAVSVFADYRNTFKPAVIDFAPEEGEEEGGILDPETSNSIEVGLKGRDGSRFFWQATAFLMDMTNLVVATQRNGLPALENGGQQRFKGFELEGEYSPAASMRLRASYGRHDARFRDYVRDFGGTLTQLRGKRLEMSAQDLASAGGTFGRGAWVGSLAVNYVGSRFLNKRNTALADPYTTVSAGIGYRAAWGELRVDGRNLTDERPAVAESELGDAQYYLLPARSVGVTFTRHF